MTGGYIYDRLLVEHLRSRGHRVEVLSLPSRGYLADLAQNFVTGWHRKLVNTPFDILIQDALIHPSFFLTNERIRNAIGYPLVGLVHSLRTVMLQGSMRQPVYRTVERRYLTSLDGYIFNSRSSRAAAARLAQIEVPSVIAYPAGDRFGSLPDRRFIRSRAEQSDTIRILFLANLLPGKGLHHLLRGLALLASEAYSLDVIGSLTMDSGYVRRIRRQIRRDRLDHRVTFHGTLTGRSLANRLRQAHLLAVPSKSEAFGMAYLEGFGFGLPALAGAPGGAREIVRHGENGYLVAPGDAAAIAAALQTLHRDRRLLTRMSLAARTTYEAHPDWEETLETIHQFLLTLLHH